MSVYVQKKRDLVGKPLSKMLREALAVVCETNGGGVHRYEYSKAVWQGLVDRDLVQGKAGHAEYVVHTPLGWKLNKELPHE